MASIFIGTLGLTLAGMAALALTGARGAVSLRRVSRVRRVAVAAILCQLGHFVEEVLYGFYVRFPEVLGLAPWSRDFFLIFNLSWLIIWILAVVGMNAFRRAGAFVLWFLAIVSMANGIAHPVLAFAVAGYFPGLWTSPAVGICGIMLFGAMMGAAERDKPYGTKASA